MLLSNLINDISKLSNEPSYNVVFDVSNKEIYKEELIKEAFENAKNQAEIISASANKKLKECIKTDFRSISEFKENVLYDGVMETKNLNISNQIFENITPEDIKITEKIYCFWIAE